MSRSHQRPAGALQLPSPAARAPEHVPGLQIRKLAGARDQHKLQGGVRPGGSAQWGLQTPQQHVGER